MGRSVLVRPAESRFIIVVRVGDVICVPSASVWVCSVTSLAEYGLPDIAGIANAVPGKPMVTGMPGDRPCGTET